MNQSKRVCKIIGHDEYPIYHICTLSECNQPTRWCCVDCITQEMHKHNKSNNIHIMKIKEFLIKRQTESDKFIESQDIHKPIQQKILERLIQECQGLENSIIYYRKYIETKLSNITQQQEEFKQYLHNIDPNNFESLDDFKINEILEINLQQFIQNQQLMPLDIQQSLYQIEQIIQDFQNQIDIMIQDFQNNKIAYTNQIIDLKNRKYSIKLISNIKYRCQTSSISQNEQCLAFEWSDTKMKIYDIKQQEIIKEIILEDCLSVCQFTHDSSQLYIGLSLGQVQGYDAQNQFLLKYEQQIHSSSIQNIITIQNEYLITSSADQTIIKTDIRSHQQIFKLIGHTDYIITIDYNEKDDIIVSGSYDRTIKLWNCSNQNIIINKKQSHKSYIQQIQLINNKQNILSLDSKGNLYKWKIDLINKDLIKLQQFNNQAKIFNFYQVNQDQNLLLIFQNYATILNKQGQIINTIEHGGDVKIQGDCKQLDNLKYIQIRASHQILLAIAQD